MQPNNPNVYPQQPLSPNPYAQQSASTPFTPPRSQGARSLALIISLVLAVLLLLGAIGFGVWAFGSRQDYKNNADKKAAAAVQSADAAITAKKDAEFAEQAKLPNKVYTTPDTYGAIAVTYPKTWSAYVVEASSGTAVIDGYFHPEFVPGIQTKTDFALHLQVLSQSYATVLNTFASSAKNGKVTIAPYTAPKVSSVIGSRIDGEIVTGKTGSIVLLPLRDKTIEISTQSSSYINDFNNTVLANLSFQP